MRFRLTFLTGMSLLFMAVGLYLAFASADGGVGKRYFFITLGILGWFIGNKLVELDERIGAIEELVAGRPGVRGAGGVEGDPVAPPTPDARPETA
jgi:hypothetical protein